MDGGGVWDLVREFCPLQHPIEPTNEDQPVKCPITTITHSSSTTINTITQELLPKELPESPVTVVEEEMKKDMVIAAADQTARSLRKRHHAHSTLASGDIVITPMIGILNNSPPPTQVFQMLHQRIQE